MTAPDPDDPRLPSVWFWSCMVIGALASAVLIGWLLFVVLS